MITVYFSYQVCRPCLGCLIHYVVQVLLAGEVPVDGAFRYAGPTGEGRGRCPPIAGRGEQLQGSALQTLPSGPCVPVWGGSLVSRWSIHSVPKVSRDRGS